MFLGTIPISDDEKEAGGDGALEEALERADGHKLRPILTCAHGNDADTYAFSRPAGLKTARNTSYPSKAYRYSMSSPAPIAGAENLMGTRRTYM